MTTTRRALPFARVAVIPLLSAALLAWGTFAHALPDCGSTNQPPCPPKHLDGGNDPGTVTASVWPKYYVLTVVYSPPGTNGGKSTSSVDYADGSTTGSGVSTSSSFKDALSVSVSVSASTPLGGGSFTATSGIASGTTDTQSMEIRKSNNNDIRVNGGSTDWIDHDRDEIWLWLNPEVTLAVTGSQLVWGVDTHGPAMDLQYVYVSWLKHPDTMPPGVAAELAARKITQGDYQTILAADPFADGTTAIDPNRFVQTATTLPYEPPLTDKDPVPVASITLKNETIGSSSHKKDLEESMGFSASTSAGALVKTEMKVSDTFTWTQSSTASSTSDKTESATAAVGGPAFGYQGPTNVAVYWDTVFNSFMFAPVPDGTVTAQGSVKSGSGTAVAYSEVLLIVGGNRYRTFTDAYGRYRFVGTALGAGHVIVGGRTTSVEVGRGRLPLKLMVRRATNL